MKNREESYTDKFAVINERPVDNISIEAFYRPHTISLFIVTFVALAYISLVRNEESMDNNIMAGVYCIVLLFIIISILTFPNGPFTRPHPAFWRIVFGLSVLYLLCLMFLLFQNYKTVKHILVWLDPKLEHFHIDMDKEYGVNCSEISLEKLWDHMDAFALAHFLGWAFKAVLVRHYGICWTVSFTWEFTEMMFCHLLPNFMECWWDALFLDVIICNGLGIWVGLQICKILEMRDYNWVGIKEIETTTGKIKRAMLQFTPSSWTHVRWLEPKCTFKRFVAICQLVLYWQVCELNTFFLKHIFEMPPTHPLVIARLAFVGIIVAPSVRQFYMYATDPHCKRVGTQCWVYGAIMVSEALLCIKNGKELFSHTQAANIIGWLLIQTLMSILCVYGCYTWHKYFQTGEEINYSSDPSPISETAPLITDELTGNGEPLYGFAEIPETQLRQRKNLNPQ
ncbi:phosphatidylserine synthase 1 isoform X1 [Cimex lectularius]|uniref:Phosphatidylserine synthase n=2 Tax=Cimex lectularius TaxID=79782 RepID=A0A8I6S792_CIMLE|nr:phosphatidylserine synthase 1 isoform X1 [Cimex lectularius]